MPKSRFNQSHVRFSDEEYAKVMDVATTYAMSIPELLRATFFQRMPPPPRFCAADADRIILALGKTARMLTHVARLLNSGYRGAFKSEIEGVRDGILAVRNFVVGRSVTTGTA